MNFMRFVAQELREHMASLGVRTVDELVGRTDLLQVREQPVNERAATVDLSAMLDNPSEGGAGQAPFRPGGRLRLPAGEDAGLRVLLKKTGQGAEEGEAADR